MRCGQYFVARCRDIGCMYMTHICVYVSCVGSMGMFVV